MNDQIKIYGRFVYQHGAENTPNGADARDVRFLRQL